MNLDLQVRLQDELREVHAALDEYGAPRETFMYPGRQLTARQRLDRLVDYGRMGLYRRHPRNAVLSEDDKKLRVKP